MEYKKIVDQGKFIITMHGNFAFSDHTEFKTLFNTFKESNVNSVEFDVGGVNFVDSAALGMFLLAYDELKKDNKEMTIRNPQGQVKKMFEISRFYEIFNII